MTYEYDFCLRCGRPGHCSADCPMKLPPSEVRPALALLVVALSGCAYLSGPCEVITNPEKRAACQTGGTMVLMPGSVLEVLKPGQ